MLARLGTRLARLLPPGLADLAGGEPPEVDARSPRETTAAELIGEVGALAANSLLAIGGENAVLLSSIDARAVLRLVDRAFGGTGQAPATLPASFPMSADLMVQRLEARLTNLLGQALGSDDAEMVRTLRRDSNLAELGAFSGDTRLAVLELEVAEGISAPWSIILALPFPTLAALFGHGERAPAAHQTGPRAADPAAAPFADMPLPLNAVLVDMQVPLATISVLEPGMVLPVSVARNVPLKIGGITIAHGSVGVQDDRTAIKLTQIA